MLVFAQKYVSVFTCIKMADDQEFLSVFDEYLRFFYVIVGYIFNDIIEKI